MSPSGRRPSQGEDCLEAEASLLGAPRVEATAVDGGSLAQTDQAETAARGPDRLLPWAGPPRAAVLNHDLEQTVGRTHQHGDP